MPMPFTLVFSIKAAINEINNVNGPDENAKINEVFIECKKSSSLVMAFT